MSNIVKTWMNATTRCKCLNDYNHILYDKLFDVEVFGNDCVVWIGDNNHILACRYDIVGSDGLVTEKELPPNVGTPQKIEGLFSDVAKQYIMQDFKSVFDCEKTPVTLHGTLQQEIADFELETESVKLQDGYVAYKINTDEFNILLRNTSFSNNLYNQQKLVLDDCTFDVNLYRLKSLVEMLDDGGDMYMFYVSGNKYETYLITDSGYGIVMGVEK